MLMPSVQPIIVNSLLTISKYYIRFHVDTITI